MEKIIWNTLKCKMNCSALRVEKKLFKVSIKMNERHVDELLWNLFMSHACAWTIVYEISEDQGANYVWIRSCCSLLHVLCNEWNCDLKICNRRKLCVVFFYMYWSLMLFCSILYACANVSFKFFHGIGNTDL